MSRRKFSAEECLTMVLFVGGADQHVLRRLRHLLEYLENVPDDHPLVTAVETLAENHRFEVAASGRAYDMPAHTRAAIDEWATSGQRPGDFVWCVLRNDLSGAAGRADFENGPRLPAIAQYIYNETPAGCWGSPEKVEAWEKRFRGGQ